MEVKIKRLNEKAVIPSYAKPGDAGMDMTATSITIDDYSNIVYGTGIAMEIPQGYVGLLFPRSSCSNKDLIMSNCVGVIDSGYRGEITAKFKPYGEPSRKYHVGDRVCQIIIMPYPQIEFVEAKELSQTSRGEGGYGSTGK